MHVQNIDRVLQDLMKNIAELQPTAAAEVQYIYTQLLMRKEHELTRAEETIRQEQQQNHEMRLQVKHQVINAHNITSE